MSCTGALQLNQSLASSPKLHIFFKRFPCFFTWVRLQLASFLSASHCSYITKRLHNSTILTWLYSLSTESESINDAIKGRSLVLSVLRALEPDTTELRNNPANINSSTDSIYNTVFPSQLLLGNGLTFLQSWF